jgi:two-component system, chemotaxis family, chemotaxis protein CheY
MVKKVLLVDDAVCMRKIIGDILRKAGHEIVGEAGNGIEAVSKFNELKPDLTFMDITMPEMDGIHAVQEIKKCDNSAKIVMCSAMGQESVVKEALKAGAIDFILKPFQPSKVLDAIQRHLIEA